MKGQMMNVKNNIDISEYFQAMILDQDAGLAFFSHILQRTRRVPNKDIGTMAIGIDTSGFVLHYNPEFISTLTYEKFVYVCKHELLHAVLGHHDRAGKKPTKLDNIAMDLAINSMLGDIDMELMYPGKPPFQDMPQGETYEQYYNRLLKKCKKGKPKPGDIVIEGDIPGLPSGTGDKQEKGECECNWDGHKKREEAQGEAGDAVARKVINEAWKSCKAQGTMPAGLDRIIQGRMKGKVNWKTQLRRFHGQFHVSGSRLTNKRPCRRAPTKAGIIPGVKNKYTSKILIALDTSGSVGDVQFKQFIGEIVRIPIPYSVIMCDAAVQGKEIKVRKGTRLKLGGPKGGGGTDFAPVFEYAAKHGFDGVVYLTDMYGSFPKTYNRPTLWVSTTEVTEAPFGKVINIKIDEQDAE